MSRAGTGTARVGCSGWSYRHWRGVLYPADAPSDRWFSYYAERFGTVELNATFYRLPAVQTVEAWAAQAPRDFTYAAKVGRFGTHQKKLRDPQSWLPTRVERIRYLGSTLGPRP